MALIDIHCNTCGEDFKADIGDMTKEELIATLKKKDSFHCNAGNHMELSSPMYHWILGEIHEGSVLTEDEWFKTMTERYGQLYNSDQLQEKFEVTGFSFGACMAKYKQTGQVVCMNFIHSPKGTWYYHGYREFEED
jgi:hypothetical protein